MQYQTGVSIRRNRPLVTMPQGGIRRRPLGMVSVGSIAGSVNREMAELILRGKHLCSRDKQKTISQ